MNFNPAQFQAIHHTNGPAMVLAGPGSGKTAVISYRIKYLIEECNIPASSILVVTFSRASALEMKERFELIAAHPKDLPAFGTFHSIFLKILKEYFGDLKVISDEQKEVLLKRIIEEMGGDSDEDSLALSASKITRLKATGETPSESFRSLFQKYNQLLRSHQLLDFDDILTRTFELFTSHHDILKQWQMRYSYILVDEFQDSSNIQYQILRMLAAPANNLFVVGDDDQSIYKFRGAHGDIMHQFLKDYPDCHQIVLDHNYRSYQIIVDAAQKMISKNKGRFDRQLICENQPIRESSLNDFFSIRAFPCQEEEFLSIASMIRKYHQSGLPYSKIAVLFRNNLEARRTKKRLTESGIPCIWKDPDLPVEESISRSSSNISPAASGISLAASRITPAASGIFSTASGISPSASGITPTAPGITPAASCRYDAVQLMTMHASKGLEFDVVFLPDINQGIVPSKNAMNPDGSGLQKQPFYRKLFSDLLLSKEQKATLYEERRILYVAMTRAKKHLHISYVHYLYNRSAIISEFLDCLL